MGSAREALRSKAWFEAGDLDGLGHRATFRMQGFSEESFTGRPVIGVLDSWSEVGRLTTQERQVATKAVLERTADRIPVIVGSSADDARDARSMAEWATRNGAKALQMEDRLGSFDKGKEPGILLIDESTLKVKRLF